MLSYSACCEVESSSNLDKILCDGDIVYQHVINRLNAQWKFIHPLFSLEEIPVDFEVEIGKFIVEKQPIVSGILMDTQENLGLYSAFASTTSGLWTVGAICSAMFKKIICLCFSILILMEKMDSHQLIVHQLKYLSHVWMSLLVTGMLFMTVWE